MVRDIISFCSFNQSCYFCNICGVGVGIDYPQKFDGLDLNPQLLSLSLSVSVSMMVIKSGKYLKIYYLYLLVA